MLFSIVRNLSEHVEFTVVVYGDTETATLKALNVSLNLTIRFPPIDYYYRRVKFNYYY